MFTTTYRHDYIPPVTNRYNFNKTVGGDKKEETKVCDCNVGPSIEPPADVLAQCGTGAAECTSMAPVGRLVEPRLIPTEMQEFTVDQAGCMRDQPNRFLKILSTCYPDLYERLKALPQDELNRRLDSERVKTTYQIDYCNVSEYPEGLYESLGDSDNKATPSGQQQEGEDACEKFKSQVMAELRTNSDGGECVKTYKPVKYSFSDSSRFTNTPNYSHWSAPPGTKKTTFSEYMDTISKTGCVITKNNIHSHTKCQNGKNCKHKLRQTCPQLT